ncbi:Uncharacterized protein {ECO:0000313/EMBL:CCF08860.1} [Pantoea ananatis]|nr:Uncharacterized protein {ECO:0000313/EMBL:CCF08860.1} [Pantoea ananatis]
MTFYQIPVHDGYWIIGSSKKPSPHTAAATIDNLTARGFFIIVYRAFPEP